MASIFCSSCASTMSDEARTCPSCGHPNRAARNQGPERSRIIGIVLALFLGGLGVHKFYTGKSGLGVVYLLFFWTFVPAIIALVEAIIWAFQSDDEWAEKQHLTAA